jgi:hypothetical protein
MTFNRWTEPHFKPPMLAGEYVSPGAAKRREGE